jgi:sRNA-binding carbon storage regulator CsrA
MVVVTGKKDAGFRIGRTIEVRVLEMRRGKVKLGLIGRPEAPTIRGRHWAYYASGYGRRLMLVVQGKNGERIRINETIDVIILKPRNGQARLGIECSPDMVKKTKGWRDAGDSQPETGSPLGRN